MGREETADDDDQRAGPPARIRVIGQTLSRVIARAPWLWPLLRGPMRRFFDSSAEGWDERTGAPGAEHLAPLAKGLLAVSPEPERALDLGTGTGVGALLLAREFPRARVRGVDISESMIRAAKAKVGLDPDGRIAFRVADAAELPWDSDSFDLVVQINMPVFCDEVSRVLRPGGSVVVATTSGSRTPFYSPTEVLEREFGKRGIETVEVGEAGRGTYWVGRAGAADPRLAFRR